MPTTGPLFCRCSARASPTPPERRTGARAPSLTLSSQDLILSKQTPTKGGPSIRHSGGVRRPAPNKVGQALGRRHESCPTTFRKQSSLVPGTFADRGDWLSHQVIHPCVSSTGATAMEFQLPTSQTQARRGFFGQTSAGQRTRRSKCRPAVESLEARLLLSGMTGQERMAHFNLTHIKGLDYTPEPSDDLPQTPPAYYDSDFWNSDFTPMWSSQKNIPGFTSKGEPVNGRGDLHRIKSIGVNAIHIYDWNPQRDHTPFLTEASADGISTTVPISNYNLTLPQTGTANLFQLENVQNIFNEVYPNWKSGNDTPATGISMWLVTNEPDLNNAYTPQQVTQLIQEVLYCENQANIPDADRLPIGVPVTFGTSWGSYSNPTPGVAQVEALANAFSTSAAFTAATNHSDPSQTVTVPALPADFFTTRFVWTINPDEHDVDSFLGKKTDGAEYPAYNHPANASSQIDWNTIPMFFTELGPDSIRYDQPAVLKHQLETVKWAQTTGKAKDPSFDGAMVFQSLDQLAHKQNQQPAERHWGIETFKTGDYQEINDTWRLDVLEPKPAWTVVKDAFTTTAKQNRRVR